MRVILLATILLLFVVLLGCASLRSPDVADIRAHSDVSPGVLVQNSLYFVHHYALYRSGTVIIPMFVATDPTVYCNVLTLYRAEIDAQGKVQLLEDLAQHRYQDRWVSSNTARHSSGAIADGKIVFTYPDGWDSETKSTVYAYIAAPLPEPHQPLGSTSQPSGTPPKYEELAFYTVWELVGVLDFRHWGLPTALDYSHSSVAGLQRLIISGDGDSYATMAAIQQLDHQQEYAALSRVADNLFRQLQPRSADSGGFAATESRLVHTVMTETLLRHADLMERASPSERAELNPLPFPVPGQLHRAAYRDDIPRVVQLLTAGADPNASDQLGIPPVTYAVLGGSPHALQTLVQSGADLAQHSDHGTPPWFIAANSPIRRPFLRLQGLLD